MNPTRLITPTVGELKRLLAPLPDEAQLELLNQTADDMIVTLKGAEWRSPAEDDSPHGSLALLFCEVSAATFYRWLMRTTTAREFLQLEEVFHEGE